MSTPEVTKFNSSFTYNTFISTPNESNHSHYQKRIIKLYTNKYPILNDWKEEKINEILESRKLKQFKLLEKEKQEAEKKEKEQQEKEQKENDQKNNDNDNDNENDNENKDEKNNNNENKNENNNNEIKDNNNSNEASKPDSNIQLNKQETKLINALELLENEYFGNEHNLYVYLCTKYKIEIICEYNNNNNMNRVIDKLLENKSDIKCIECAEIKPYYSYNKSELENGYFAACKECAPDRDSVKTLKWSAIYKSADTQLKNNNFVLQNSRDSHRYACVDMNNPMKQGIHCFRWYVKGHRSWLLLGISKPRKHRDGSYSDQGVFGIASAGTYYKNGATMYDIPAAAMYEKQEIFIDMKLDLSKYEMSYMVVGDAQKRLMKMTGIDKNNKDGYIPHVNVYYQSVTLQIKKIPSSWFGKNPKRCKFKY